MFDIEWVSGFVKATPRLLGLVQLRLAGSG